MDPIKWKSKIILAGLETTEGVDPVLTGASNAMLMTDVQLQPMEGEDVSRNLELAYLGAQSTFPTGLRVVLTGSVELVGSGTAGTPPAWAPLLRACAVAEVITAGVSVEYTPVSDGHESAALYFHIGPSLHVLLGARGTAVVTMNAQGIPVARFTLTGLFTLPADAARPAIDQSKFQKPQVATKKNTPLFKIGAQPFVLRSYELNLGNDVQARMLIGAERIIIVDRAEKLTVTVEAVPYAIYNPFAVAQDKTPKAIVIEHGTEAGKKVGITVGQAEQDRPGGLSQNQNIVEWSLGFTPIPTDTGNDQWSILLT